MWAMAPVSYVHHIHSNDGNNWVVELIQQLKVLPAIAEDLGSLLRTHISWLI